MLAALHPKLGSGQTRKALYLMAKLDIRDPAAVQWLARRAVQVAHLMDRFAAVQTLWSLATINIQQYYDHPVASLTTVPIGLPQDASTSKAVEERHRELPNDPYSFSIKPLV